MKTNHTPGPWTVEMGDEGLVIDSSEHAIGSLDCPSDVMEANARLTAAAPDLLQALIRMLPYLHNFPEFQQIEVTSAILKAAPELKEHLQNYPLAA